MFQNLPAAWSELHDNEMHCRSEMEVSRWCHWAFSRRTSRYCRTYEYFTPLVCVTERSGVTPWNPRVSDNHAHSSQQAKKLLISQPPRQCCPQGSTLLMNVPWTILSPWRLLKSFVKASGKKTAAWQETGKITKNTEATGATGAERDLHWSVAQTLLYHGDAQLRSDAISSWPYSNIVFID